MKEIRPSFCRKVNYSSGEPAPLRSQVAGLHFELLNRILCRNQHWQVDVADVEGLAGEILGALISECATHLVIPPPERIDSYRCARRTALRNYRRRQNNQVKDIAPVQRKFVGFPLFDDGAYGGRLGVDRQRLSFHGHALRRGATHHFKVHFQRILHVQNYSGLDHCLEPEFLDLDPVTSRWKIGNVVSPSFVGESLVMNSGAAIDDRNNGTGDHRFVRVGDSAGERCLGGLRLAHTANQQTEHHSENQFTHGDPGSFPSRRSVPSRNYYPEQEPKTTTPPSGKKTKSFGFSEHPHTAA